MSHDPDLSPVNPLPPAVTLLFLAIVAVEAAFSLGEMGVVGGPDAIGWRIEAVQAYAFFDQIFDQMRALGLADQAGGLHAPTLGGRNTLFQSCLGARKSWTSRARFAPIHPTTEARP